MSARPSGQLQSRRRYPRLEDVSRTARCKPQATGPCCAPDRGDHKGPRGCPALSDMSGAPARSRLSHHTTPGCVYMRHPADGGYCRTAKRFCCSHVSFLSACKCIYILTPRPIVHRVGSILLHLSTFRTTIRRCLHSNTLLAIVRTIQQWEITPSNKCLQPILPFSISGCGYQHDPKAFFPIAPWNLGSSSVFASMPSL